ncbi:MAG TPA: hypothetical protein VF032_10320 [Thermoleophilaceae bacterium]
MACDPLRFGRVDASKWSAAKEMLSSEYGISIDTERGEQAHRGFTLAWTYEPSAQTLEIQCRAKPFLIPCGVVNSRIDSLAERCGIDRA